MQQRHVVNPPAFTYPAAHSDDLEVSACQDVHYQFVAHEDPSEDAPIGQAIGGFLADVSAEGVVDTTENVWQRFANRNVNLRRVADTTRPKQYWATGEVLDDGHGGIRMTWTREVYAAWTCDDAMAADNDMVVGLEVCGRISTAPVIELVEQLSDNTGAAA